MFTFFLLLSYFVFNMPYDISKSYSLSRMCITGSTTIDVKNSTISNMYSNIGKYSFVGSGLGSTIFPTSVPDNTRCNILGQKLTLEVLPEKETEYSSVIGPCISAFTGGATGLYPSKIDY